MVIRDPSSRTGKFAFYLSNVSFLFSNMIESTARELHCLFSPSAEKESNHILCYGIILRPALLN
jgi:hypothetical protein